jgi:glycosyltransferase involved in cell wall biosynthesis
MSEAEVKRVLLALQTVAIGGMETLCVDVAAELHRRGIDVAAVIPRNPPFDILQERFQAAGASVYRLNTDSRASRLVQLKDLVSFVRLLRRWRPDVVNLQTGGATGGLAAIALARLVTPATVVATEHDVPVRPRPSLRHASSRSLSWVVRALLDRLCHAVIAVSRRNAGLRRKWLDPGAHKLAVSLNGVPIQDTPPAVRLTQRRRVRRELAIDAGAPVIGTLCRLTDDKGLEDLLSAFALVRQAHPCELVLVGDGPLRGELEQQAHRLGVSDGVHFAGYHADAKPYLSAFDIFVLPVPSGTMSIAVLEAMAHGLPPVITFCGPEEAVVPGWTGLCAAPHDPCSLAASLTRLVEDADLRARLGAAAAEHVRRHFSIARVTDDWLEIYATCRRGVAERLRSDHAPATFGELGG